MFALFQAVDVNHGVVGASGRFVDGLLGSGVLVTFVVVVMVVVVVGFRSRNVRDVRGRRGPSDVLGVVHVDVIDSKGTVVPGCVGLVPDIEGPVPGCVGFEGTDAGDVVAPGAERGVDAHVVVAKDVGGEVPTGRVFGEVVGLRFEHDRGVVRIQHNEHVVVLFFLRGQVGRFVGAFVQVFAQVGDQHRFELKGKVAVGHCVGGHGRRGGGAHCIKGAVHPSFQTKTVVKEQVCSPERNDVSWRRFVVVHRNVGGAEELHVDEVAAHRFSELLNVVRGHHDGKIVIVVLVRHAASKAGGNQHQGKKQRS